jgi:DNA helicase-2/ATP-dependent DNA helicase PcrA
MNMHKSKGKEFDEVIIWEELYKQIVTYNATESRLQQDRLILRVAITRAKAFVSILTPERSPCILL